MDNKYKVLPVTLLYQIGNSDKLWSAWAIKDESLSGTAELLLIWGRRGQAQQGKLIHFDTWLSAYGSLKERVYEKTEKGYHKVNCADFPEVRKKFEEYYPEFKQYLYAIESKKVGYGECLNFDLGYHLKSKIFVDFSDQNDTNVQEVEKTKPQSRFELLD